MPSVRCCVVATITGLAAGPMCASGIGLFEWTPATGDADWGSLLQIGSDAMGNPIFLSNWDRTGINQGLLVPDGGDTALFNADALVTGAGGASAIIIGAARTLTLGFGASIGVEGVSLDNNGTLTFVADPINNIPGIPDQQLTLSGNVKIGGGGTIALTDSESSFRFNAGSSINTDNLIRGAGQILLAQGSTLTNQSTIRADVPGETLSIAEPLFNGDPGVFVNDGTLEAINGSILVVSSIEVLGGGSLHVDGSSTLQTFNSPLVEAGSFTVDPDGTVLGGATTFANMDLHVVTESRFEEEYVLKDASIFGTLVLRNTLSRNDLIGLDGIVTNYGLITYPTNGFGQIGLSPGDNTTSGSATLTGTGELVLVDEFSSRVRCNGSFGVNGANIVSLTQGSAHAIRGTGNIDLSASIFGSTDEILSVFNNEGSIEADVSGMEIAIVGRPNHSLFNNTGTLGASNGGVLRLTTCELNQTGGVFDVEQGSTLEMSVVVIRGDALHIPESGDFELDDVFLENVILSGLVDSFRDGELRDSTNNGTIFLASTSANNETRLRGVITNNGLITYATGSGQIGIQTGSATLTGTGELVMTDEFGSRVICEGLFSSFNGAKEFVTLTHGPDHTIRGTGRISINPTVAGPGSSSFDEFLSVFENEGSIEADVSGMEIAILGRTNNSLLANDGLLRARGGGILRLSSLEVRGAGTVSIEAGSSFDFNAQRLECSAFLGDFDHDTGVFSPQFPPAALRGTPATSLLDGDYTQSTGSPVFEAALNSRDPGGFTSLLITGDAALTGSLIVLSDPAFDPMVGDRFEIIRVDGTLTSEFNNFAEGDSVGIFNGTELFITYLGGDGNDIELVTEDCPADVNGDGIASPADFTAWLGCFNNPASAPFCGRADVNGNGSVEPSDFTAWLAAFNAGC